MENRNNGLIEPPRVSVCYLETGGAPCSLRSAMGISYLFVALCDEERSWVSCRGAPLLLQTNFETGINTWSQLVEVFWAQVGSKFSGKILKNAYVQVPKTGMLEVWNKPLER